MGLVELISEDCGFIGNENLLERLKRNILLLTFYDDKSQTNPSKRDIETNSIITGPPESGKTTLLKYLLTYAKELSENTGRDIEVVRYDVKSQFTDGALSMMMQSNLEINKGEKRYLIMQDDFYGFSSEIAENMRLFAEYQKFYRFGNRGNHLFICTTSSLECLPESFRDISTVLDLEEPPKEDIIRYSIRDYKRIDLSKQDYENAARLASGIPKRKLIHGLYDLQKELNTGIDKIKPIDYMRLKEKIISLTS